MRTVLAMTSTCWKKVPMKMMAIFGRVIDAEDGDAERAKGRRGQVAEEFDEWLLEPGEEPVSAAEDAERHADERGDEESPRRWC